MKTEYLEPWVRTYPNKTELIKVWSDWFESKFDEWELFTITVVFKAGGKIPRPDRWNSEFDKCVLRKIRKALEPNEKNRTNAIPFEEFCYYEFDESSIHRITSSRKPHHIHGLLPIRKSQVSRFWSIDENGLKERIKKDIHSTGIVQSLEIKPIKENSTINWLTYITKMKSM